MEKAKGIKASNLSSYLTRKVMEKYGGETFLSIYDNEEITVVDGQPIKKESDEWWRKNVLETKHSEEEWEAYKKEIRGSLPVKLLPLYERLMPWIDLNIWPKTV